MRIAICDDTSEHLENIKNAAYTYFKTHNDSIEIESFNHAFDLLDTQEKLVYDLVLLDVCMPGMLGTEVAKEIRLKKSRTEIIFITTSNEFAVDAFEVNALHYLLKPFTQDAFNQAMDRAMHHIDHKRTKMLYLKCPKGIIQSVDKNKITYIEADAYRKYVYLDNGNHIETVQMLSELFETLHELSPLQFVMPYKGYIVNQQAISRIESQKIVLKNEKGIPIPRRTFNLIKDAYFNYMFEGRNA